MRTHAMGEMTVKEVREYLKTNQTIILPYGVVEQHGYHLPLSTDTHFAEIPAYALAERLDCIVAPPLNYCFSGGELPGTINVRPTTFCAMVCDIVEALSRQGFRNILIYPGHGGSESLMQLKEALRILKWVNKELADTMILIIQSSNYLPWPKAEKAEYGDFHAGEGETSVMMAFRPELVRTQEICVDELPVAEMMRKDPDAYQLRTTLSGLPEEIPATSMRKEIKVGVMGYPELADPQKARDYLEAYMNAAVPVLRKAIADADACRQGKKKPVEM